MTAGAVCTGAFFGDKVSPLSDSPVITATVCEVPLMDGIRHALISTGATCKIYRKKNLNGSTCDIFLCSNGRKE